MNRQTLCILLTHILSILGCVPDLKPFDLGADLKTMNDSGDADLTMMAGAHSDTAGMATSDVPPPKNDGGLDDMPDLSRVNTAGQPASPSSGGQNQIEQSGGTMGVPPACRPEPLELKPMTRPIDLIMVVSSPLSMRPHINQLPTHVRNLVQTLNMGSVDYKVTLIASDGEISREGATYLGVCMPPPLSLVEQCPDEDSAIYRHIREPIYRHDSLDIVSALALSNSLQIRADSKVHMLIVSDNDYTGPVTKEQLINAGFPNDFSFHSLVDTSQGDQVSGRCDAPDLNGGCACGVASGQHYMTLSENTGGLVMDLCVRDWRNEFNQFAQRLTETSIRPCGYQIPIRASLNNVNAEEISVVLIDGQQQKTRLSRTDDCQTDPDGWKLVDSARQIQVHLCPDSCSKMDRKVVVEYGCTQ